MLRLSCVGKEYADALHVQIPGTTNLKRLEENIGALHLQLTKEEEQEIRKTSEAAEVQGGRYPEAARATLFADTPPLSA